MISFGTFLLLWGAGWKTGGLGLFAILWYNGVYTYLKRRTAFAAVPGALVGVIPPVLGWVSGGGNLLDHRIWAVSFFFFIWQVPHFWLLLMDSGEDYKKAGLPSLTEIFTTFQLKRIISIWVLSTAVSCLVIPLFGFLTFSLSHFFLLGLTLWLVWKTVIFFKSPSKDLRLTFMKLNVYVLLVISVLSVDILIRSGW